jgi:Leucine-rich repeat (LRR) protein
LENNRLEILPDSMDELKTLVRLDISTNNLTFLPQSMGKLKKIQRIDAANNQLAKVPPCMGHCKTLKEFNVKWDTPSPPLLFPRLMYDYSSYCASAMTHHMP